MRKEGKAASTGLRLLSGKLLALLMVVATALGLVVGVAGNAAAADGDAEFVLTDKLEAGKEYLIANGNTGSVYVLTREEASQYHLKGISASVVDGKITLTEGQAADAAFACELENESNPSSVRLMNNSQYLYDDSRSGSKETGKLRMVDWSSSYDGKFWHYKGDDANLLWFFKDSSSAGDGYSDTSSTYKYYLKCDSDGIFYGPWETNLANAEADKIYLFSRDIPEVKVTGVTLDKTELELSEGTTAQLTATVEPAKATNKKVTWSSSNEAVAKVDQNGLVTAVAQGGPVTITATSDDNADAKATCAVTVKETTYTKYVEVKSLVAGKNYVLVAKSGSSSFAMKYGSTPSPQAITVTEATGGAAAYVMVPDTDEGKTLVWNTTDGSSAGYVYLVGSGGNTLYFGSGSVSTSSSSKRNTDLVNGKLVGKGSSSNYYVTCDGEKFSAGTSESGGADFRVFVKESEVAPVTGVTLDKDTLELVAGKTGQLTATVAPAGATNKDVAWSSDKASVATVDASGLVTGVAEGSATITVTTEDGGKTATCAVTVTKAPDPVKFVLTDELKDGGEYLIVNTTTAGSAYALKNPGGSSSGVTISSSNGKTNVVVQDGDIIMTADTDIVWTASTNGDGFYLTNGTDYLEVYQQSLRVFSGEPKQSARYWTYDKDGNLAHIGGSSPYIMYYNNSGSFSASSSAATSVYLFKKDTGDTPTVNVDSVSVDPTTLEIAATKTAQLTATVSPTGATNKKVTWASNKPEVATVDANGLVTGVAEGTATITVTTEDGGKTATCAVTVTKAPEASTYTLASSLRSGGEYLIVSANTAGDAFAVKNNGGSSDGTAMDAAPVTVSTDAGKTVVKTADTDVVWTATPSDDGFTLTNGTDYIEGKGGDIKIYSARQYSARYWTYADDVLTFVNPTVGSRNYNYMLYYSSSSSKFTYSSYANSSTPSTVREVYIYEKDGTGADVPVEGVELDQATLEVAATKTGQLTATVSPAGATNKNITWSSSDEKVATVDQSGLVTGVAEGTATITVTTEDGGKTATCAVTVTKAPEAVKFILTDELEDGGEYLIVNTTTAGSAYALKNPGGTSSGVATTSSDKTAVTIQDDDSITTGDTDIVWTATENGGGFNLSNDGSYIEGYYSSGEKLYVFKPQKYADRYWTYAGNQLKHNGGTSAYTLCYSNSTFTTTRTSGNTDEVYLYKKLTEQVDVTGVTVDPKTASVEAGGSVQLSASVAPANASNKKVIWSSSDEKIATVDQNGKVKGVAEGEVTITATSKENDTIKDSCEVTVTKSTLSDKRFLILIGDHALTNQPTNDQLINNNGNYVYSGLAGADYVAGGTIDETMSWILEETEGGYYIKSEDGKYLNATYTSVSNPSASNPTTGVLKLDDTKDVWSISGDLESWELDGSKLKSANSTKYLNYESGTTDAPINLFTVRSESNAASTKIVEISSTPVETFTVTFLNDDGTELSSRKYATGTKAADIEKPANPTKEPTTEIAYTFDKWTPDIVDVTADATYTATYTSAPRQYTVKFVDEDGTTVLKAEEKYNYGTPWERVEKPEDPTKDGYTFAGWTNVPETITADVVVKASYSKNVKVTFVDDDGKTVLKDETEYPIGVAWADIEKPADPTKDPIGGMTFTFDGWDPQVETVTANTVFKATYKKSSATGDKWLRLKGKGRYQTMSAIVSAGFSSSNAIVLASGEKFADALVASALAGALDCPIVLTEQNVLTAEAKQQIETLRPTDVYVVGGKGAVSEEVRNQVDKMVKGYDEGAFVLPLGGSTRIETSRIVAGMVIGLDPAADTVVIATGENFADALAVSPWCYAKHYPIMLADKNGNLSDDQIDDIVVKYAMKKAIIVGGTGVVSADIESALKDEGLTVERWKGSNRYDTAAKIAKNELKDGMTVTNVAVATGNNFADALAGAALCGHNNSILVLAESENHKTSPALDIIESRADEITLGYILGGTGAVSESLEAHLNDLTD